MDRKIRFATTVVAEAVAVLVLAACGGGSGGADGPATAAEAGGDSIKQAQAAGDADTVNLMDIQRIYMTHEDAAIDTSLEALHAVRARVTDAAPVEVREALERAYGNMYFDAGNFDSALRHQLAALALVAAAPDPASARLYRLGTIAELYNAMGLPQDALAYTAREAFESWS